MGMFDELTILFELPWPEVQDSLWQTKDTPAQSMDYYEVREDGTLWHHRYDERLIRDEVSPIGRSCHRIHRDWKQVDYSGELECHEHTPGGVWYIIRFWFVGGVVADAIYTKSDG